MARTNFGVSEAKNNLSELLDRAQAGEVISITRHGKQIALLVPFNHQQSSVRRAIARLRKLRK
jgi:prevent-host-death family protein